MRHLLPGKLEYSENVVVFRKINLKGEFGVQTENMQMNIFQVLISLDFADKVLHLKKIEFKNSENFSIT